MCDPLIYIENLGAIRRSNINITPLTILAGENGTGKSFVTKFLYSVLSVINVDTYSNHTLEIANNLSSTLAQINDFLVESSEDDEIGTQIDFEEDIIFLKDFHKSIQNLANSIKLIETDYYAFDEDFIFRFQKKVTLYVKLKPLAIHFFCLQSRIQGYNLASLVLNMSE